MTGVYRYGVYGAAVECGFPLSLPPCSPVPIANIRVRRAAVEAIRAGVDAIELITRDDWYRYGHLPDGSSYVSWQGLGEFRVTADGGEILCAQGDGAPDESFQVYLLGQALSFALVKAGFEPLHGTAVVQDGEAIALLGEGGYGKSTLAASFLAKGASLLTDDLLLVRPEGGRLIAYPGPSRIKLFPDSADRFLRDAAVGVPMNAFSSKHVIPLAETHRWNAPAPLRAAYDLAPPDESEPSSNVVVSPLSPREAFFALIRATFNRYISDPERMARQHAQTSRLSRIIVLRRLAYPRTDARIGEVREAILADCAAGSTAAA